MSAVSYHDTVNVVQALGLVPDAPIGPFDRVAWFTLLERDAGLPVFAALAREGDAFAMLPLMREGRGLASLANWYSFTWRPLGSAGGDRAALIAELAESIAERFPLVTLSQVPGEDGSADLLETAFKAGGWTVLREAHDTNHYLDVAGRSYAEYLAARPGPLRTTLKRKTGKVETRIIAQFEASAWDSYEQIYAASWKPEEGAPAMLRAFAEQEGAAGRVRLGLALADGEPVAAQFWTVENGVAWIHKLAHLDRATPLSAGTVLTAALMAHVIDADRVREVDFGTGDDPYKRDWMEAVRPRFRLTCLRSDVPRNWPTLAKAKLRRLVSHRGAG